MKEILIYDGEGTSRECVNKTFHSLATVVDMEFYRIRLVNHRFLESASWEAQTAALIIPGGRDRPYHQQLSGAPNQKIRSYVSRGGAYLGICAGAYYGCASIEFEKGNPLEILGERELGFFPGLAKGPAMGSGIFEYESNRGAQAALISWLPEKTKKFSFDASIYYHGGCFFDRPEKHKGVEVLSRFEELEDRPAAIIQCKVGCGLAILSGVHPEVNLSSVFSISTEVEERRKKLWKMILKRLNLYQK